MLLRKTMSLLGIGSAQIDLILDKEIFRPGEQVTGYFLLKGGTIEQHIKRIECDLILEEKKNELIEVVDSTTILSSRIINPDEEDKLPFTFTLQENIEPSTNDRSYRFKTKLTFNEGVESKDQDIIQIVSS